VLADALRPLGEHELVAEVRAIGLLGGVELRARATEERPDLPDRVAAEAMRRGVIVRVLRNAVFQVSPPFVVSEEQLATIAHVLRESLDAATASP